MKISDTAIESIKNWEGFRNEAYYCPAGKLTIGYGHTSAAGAPAVTHGMTISAEQGEAILRQDLKAFENGVLQSLTRKPSQRQFDAFVSLAFNIGLAHFRGSTCRKRFNAGDYAGAAEAITWWNKATVNGEKVILKGLVRRREVERQWFVAGIMGNTDVRDLPVSNETITGGEQKKTTQSKTAGAGAAGAVLGGLSLWGEIKTGAPEIVNTMAPWMMAAAVAVCVFIIWNRHREASRGEH